MAFAPVFGRPFAPTFDRHAAAALWWLSGGVSAANAIAVYHPKGAASLVVSYTNLANPGIYNAAPGVAPTLVANGWNFNGTQWLNTGVIPTSSYSIIVRYADTAAPPQQQQQFMCGLLSGSRFHIGMRSGDMFYGFGEGFVGVVPIATSGVFGLTGDGGYRNGIFDGAVSWTTFSTAETISIAARSGGWFFTGTIQALAIYSATLTATEMAAVSAAMAAL